MNEITFEQFADYTCKALLDSFKDISAFKSIFPATPEHLLKQEIAALELFEMLIAFNSYYKNNPNGIKIFNITVDKYKHALVELKIFTDNSSCNKFIETRLMAYKDILEKNQDKNSLSQLSFKMTDFFGGKDISQSVVIMTIYVDMVKANINFIQDIDTKVTLKE